MEENVAVSEDENYNFITECFFLCHQAINQGFHVVHEKFMKINQELHRIQRSYQNMRSQVASDEVEPLRTIKIHMEKGRFLCSSCKKIILETRKIKCFFGIKIIPEMRKILFKLIAL